MRSIFTTGAAVVIAVIGLLTFYSSPINAAVFAVLPYVFTYFVCMDVMYDSTAAGAPVIAYDCHNGYDQQFEFAGPDCVTQTSFSACTLYPNNVPPVTTIYTVPRNPLPTGSASYFNCLDVAESLTSNFTSVISYPCNGVVNQQFIYYNGQIFVYTSINSPICLDATDIQTSRISSSTSAPHLPVNSGRSFALFLRTDRHMGHLGVCLRQRQPLYACDTYSLLSTCRELSCRTQSAVRFLCCLLYIQTVHKDV